MIEFLWGNTSGETEFRLKNFRYYGFDKVTYDSCQKQMEEGNRQSFSFVLLAEIFVLLIRLVVAFFSKLPIATNVLFTVALVGLTAVYFLFPKFSTKYGRSFYFASFFLILWYSVYAMNTETYEAAVLYPVVAILLPLFYMTGMIPMMVFLASNMALYLILAFCFSDTFGFLAPYVLNVVSFSLAGMGIHYVYQSNRIHELLTKNDSDRVQRALEIRSNFETLSRLLRRRTFVDMAEKSIARRKFEDFTAVAIIDIDHFKMINDTYGHQLGDRVITSIGRVIAETLSLKLTTPMSVTETVDWEADYGNLAGRLGGDEFIFVITSEKSEADVIHLMEDLIHNLNHTNVGEMHGIQASVGISIVTPECYDYDALYHQADTALYKAKHTGRNRVMVYTKDQDDALEETMQVVRDPLTGLLQMNPFKEQANLLMQELATEQMAIVYFDIDNFKSYNAKYGFDNGDLFLQAVADALLQVYPKQLLGRFADDHFVALVPTEDIEHSLGKVKYLVRKYRSDFRSTIRTGVYEIDHSNFDINLACDRAKSACDAIRGRYDLQVQFFDEGLNQQLRQQQHIIEHLDEAIANEWIKVYYQQVVRSYTGECCGMEALARWHDPHYGVLPPKDFIETLEQFHLIYKLDLHMIRMICRDYKMAMKEGKPFPPVSVNLSRLDFDVVDMITEVEECIREYNVPRNMLHIEITESALTTDEERLREIVDEFRHLGYQVWMDDFGSGYSSLNVMKDYNFDVLKLDMAFLTDTGSRSREILTSIVDMAKKLGMQTLAEGVETEEQFQFLKSIGCEMAQGYLFSKPTNLEQVKDVEHEFGVGSFEKLSDRDFYTKVGRINVLGRDIMWSQDRRVIAGNKQSIAIIEYRAGKIRYLMNTSEYERNLENFGFGTIEDSEAMMNHLTGEELQQFREKAESYIRTGVDHNSVFEIHGKRGVQYVECVAFDEMADRAAFVSVFSELDANRGATV